MSGLGGAIDAADLRSPAAGPSPEESPRSRTVAAAAPHAGVLVILFGLAIALTWSIWITGHPTTSVLCSCGDPGQAVWFLEWVPWSIQHGHNPFLTQAMFAGQGGANLLQSTSYLLQSFVLSPVTWVFGPTASFNVALTMAPVVSGWCMFVAARRVTGSWLGQTAAAVLWGFSPFVVSADQLGHLDFALLFFPPLVFVCLFELCASDRRSPRWIGLWLGLLLAAQFLAGTELLALTVLTAAVGMAAAAIINVRQAWERRRRIVAGFGVAAAVSAVVLAYPIWVLIAGPRHIVGAPWPGIGLFASQPASIVDPGAVHASSSFLHAGGYFGAVGPGAAYLGWPLLVFIAVSAFVWRRRRVVWVLCATGVAMWLCSLGVLLLPLGIGSRQWWLPWQYLQHLPLIGSLGPTRFAVSVTGVAALLLAVSVDGWLELAGGLADRQTGSSGRASRRLQTSSGRRVRPRWRLASRAIGLSLACALAVAAFPIVRANSWPFTMHTHSVPAWFETTARKLPPSSIVLVYPYPSSGAPDAVYWQARDDMAFRLVGGRAEIPGADGRHSQHLDPLGGTDAYLVATSFGFTIPPAPSATEVTQLRASLAGWRVNVVVIVAVGRAPAWAAAVFTAALGRLPFRQQGALAWYSPGANWEAVPPLSVSAAAIEECSGDGYSQESIEAAPACVLAADRL